MTHSLLFLVTDDSVTHLDAIFGVLLICFTLIGVTVPLESVLREIRDLLRKEREP